MFKRELNPNECQTRVYADRDVYGHQCQNKPVVTREGKLYCKIHDPEYIKQRDAERRAKWEKEDTEREAMWRLRQARNDATKGLTLAELNQVTPDLIRKALKGDKINKGGFER